jgi:hypothetical protein
MTSIRLSVGMKEQIERRLIHYRFSEEAQQLVAEYAQLASDVYDDVYPNTTQKKMKELPKGWLPTTASISVQFGEAGLSYANLAFAGICYGEISYAGGQGKVECETCRLVPYNERNGCVKQYPYTHPLSKRYDELETRYKALEERIRAGRKAARAAMDQVTTLARLIEVWPEIAPFTEGFERRNTLPAISRPDLNGLLGLPKETAA